MTDESLSRALTAEIRAVDGVTGVWSPRPLVQAAEVVVSALSLHEPDVLVDLDRTGGTLRVSVDIAVDDRRPAPDTVRAVGERIRDLVDERSESPADLVSVTIRLVEGIGRTPDELDPASQSDEPLAS